MTKHSTPKRTKEATLAEKLKKAEKIAREKAIKERAKFRGLQIRPTPGLFDESEKQEPGENNWSGFGFDIHPHVTVSAVIILAVFIIATLMFQEQAAALSSDVLAWVSRSFGWFFILAANIFIGCALYFAFSRFGRIRIGGAKALPEFSTPAWYAMLLSAGMGIGLMFWSVGEPMFHFSSPSPMFIGVEGGSPAAAQAAMGLTYFHWGLHPWAIYSIVGLGLAFFAYNRGLPLTIRSIFYPILGNRIYGRWGDFIDVLSVLATLMGLATSLGLGVSQINAGLHHLFDVDVSTQVQVLLIAIITAIATFSVMSGLDGGVKRLSELNMGLAGLLLLFVLIAGPTIYILSGFTQNLGFYIENFAQLSLWTETFRDSNWQGSWTVFYWAWWISWSPFVGMFIARISKGRTVREFILGVMVVPTLLSFLWMSVFGGSALWMESTGVAKIADAVNADVATAMFAMFEHLPISGILSFVGIVLVSVFFITSSDSGSLVVDHLTSGGKLDSPVPQRVFWAIMEGVVAAVLLLGGGLHTLQTASIVTGLPFTVVLLLICYSLYLGLTQEAYVEDAVEDKLRDVHADHRLDEAISSAHEVLLEKTKAELKD
ncbi:BCCT family transporter [Coraliomargarita sp. SDUM461003]|uniref:BCCT family transporter n=1 Tax=Thalassobacterium maritimum TaxID=3041265 RepID=A0ABU1ARC5_9BACT|nr:BCCT family transporter [Coraliomargarita sp. SDUM461003]MBT64634.1 glycine/betaine ABC transporter [Puniceicoccaceae bacterium]MDQ8206710.1 BCCT family transporter [Coraliomargarita sp. SDUM461003]|tara:strand:- start:12399 stop:14201 length:1803 start_codon:yes stop_codon:yes gene_type:complete